MKPCNVLSISAFAFLTAFQLISGDMITVTASLDDGSRIKGEFLETEISGSTMFSEKLSLDPIFVTDIKFSDTNGNAKVELSSNDLFAMRLSAKVYSIKTKLGKLDIPLSSLRELKLSHRTSGTSYDNDLIFHCTFDSAKEILKPAIGPEAITSNELTLISGKKGNALRIQSGQSTVLAYNLFSGYLQSKGCIEFWAKFDNNCPSFGKLPQFFLCRGQDPVASIYLNWNVNNGGGGGGLCGKFQHYPATSDAYERFRSFYDYFGESENEWHHYALVWNFDGIQNVETDYGASIKVAVFLDGKLTATRTNVKSSTWKAFGFINQNLTLGFPDAPANSFSNSIDILIDEFKIWATDKTDFDL